VGPQLGGRGGAFTVRTTPCWSDGQRADALTPRSSATGVQSFLPELRDGAIESRTHPDRFPEQPRAGPFVANLSGFLLGLVYRLPGLRLGAGDPSTWPSRPVVLPAGWEAIEVERLWVHGRPARLIARHGEERAQLEVACKQ
jgi:hypothetical protein